MKYFVVFSALLVLARGELTKEFKEKFLEEIMKIGEVCSEQVGATEDDVKELIEKKVPTSHEGKCLIACMNKKFKILHENGEIDKAGAIASLAPFKEVDADLYGKLKSTMETCATEVKNDADECETAAKLYACCKRVGKEHGLHEDMIEM